MVHFYAPPCILFTANDLTEFSVETVGTASQSGHAVLTQVRSMCSFFELYHAAHYWHPLFYTSPMASSALQH